VRAVVPGFFNTVFTAIDVRIIQTPVLGTEGERDRGTLRRLDP